MLFLKKEGLTLKANRPALPVVHIKRFTGQAFLFLFLLLSLRASSQLSVAPDYHNVDSNIFLFSRSTSNHFDSLIPFVKRTFSSNQEKVRAFYTWIALNISYDKNLLDTYRQSSPQDLQNFSAGATQQPDTILKYRKAVCEGFCYLMNRCCEKCGIVSKMVIGVTKLEGVITDDILHAWNAVMPDTAWCLLDITWSNGYVDQSNHYVKRFSGNYFFTSPLGFIQNHWPLDAMWQLSDYPVTKNSFYKNTSDDKPVFFNYRDSIAVYQKLKKDTLEYVSFLHYHAADPENDTYMLQCDRIIHDKLVGYLNQAAAGFESYQRYTQKYEGKPLNAKMLRQCIELLREPEKNLVLGSRYSKNKTFFHADVRENFRKMTLECNQNLKKVQSTIDSYRKLIKSLQTSKK